MKGKIADIKQGIPVDQTYVHKHRTENVLISNLRRALPPVIDRNTFEKTILASCTELEYQLLKQIWLKSTESPGDEYILTGVRHQFTMEEVRMRLSKNHYLKDDIRFFLKFYRKKRNQSVYVFHGSPDENDLSRLARITGSKKNPFTDIQKSEVSDILDCLGIIANANIFYANMIVDINHYYFFEHPNEHVPGMMVIEAVRQLLVACTHKYGKVPLSGYNFVLSSMTGNFKSYLELNYPILLKVIQTNAYTFDSGIWSDSDFTVHVYQNEKECVVMTFQESILTHRVFSRLRENRRELGERQWFVLKNHIEYSSILRIHGMKKLDTRIEYLSFGECIVITENTNRQIIPENGTSLEFFMYFSRIGFIHGSVQILNRQDFDTFSQFHLRFTEMDIADKHNLREVIKKYAYHVEE